MHAIILAGGAGTRLRPLTYARRKELIPLLNRPLLEYRLRNLRDHGIADIVLACSQGSGEIEQHFGDGSALGVRLQYVYEEQPLGSGRAVKEASRAAGAAGTIVVCNGDILTNIDLRAMIARHRDAGATLSISLAPVDDPWHFGVVAVDQELRISHFIEKPPRGEEPSNLINAGTWLWEPEVLARIPDDDTAIRDQFSERVLFPGIIADGLRVQGFEEDLWVDVGAPDRYFRATRLLLEREAARRGTSMLFDPTASIEDGAEIEGNVMIGAGSHIGTASRITGPTVIGEHVVVIPFSSINTSIIWDDVRIGPATTIEDSIIGSHVRIGADVNLDAALIADGATVPDSRDDLPAGLRLMPGEAWVRREQT
jgi:mannose-1-phosphate guanylyltransferase